MDHETGKNRIRRMLEAADALPSRVRLAIAIALLLVVAAADWLTPNEVAFASIYLVPIAIAAWFVSSRTGTLMALAGTILWFSLNLPDERGSSWIIGAWNIGARLGMFLFVSALVSGARDLLDSERQRARIDALTDVFNARAFYEIVEREIARTRRFHRPMSLAYIDLDDFKDINDHFGHVAGDELLRTFATCVKETIRSIDSVARLGGDEFAVLMPETDTEGALVAIQRLNQSIDTIDRRVSVSIGVVTCDDPVPESIDEIIRRADTLMYTAKHLGKRRFIQGSFNDVIDSIPSRQTSEVGSG